MNREDIKYVRKIETIFYGEFIVEVSNDNTSWYTLIRSTDEWLCDLIVDEIEESKTRQLIGYSSTGKRMYRE